MYRATFVTVIAVAALAFLSGCSSSSNAAIKRSVRATTSLDQTRSELTSVISQTTSTMDSLKALESAEGDLRAPFNAYVREVNRLSADIDRARARFRDFDDRATVYIENWRKEASEIESEGVRAAAEQRIEQASADFAEVSEAAKLAGELIDPLMNHLLDIQTALSNDLTTAGVDAMASEMNEADLTAMQFKRRVGALQQEIDAVAAKWARERPAAEPAAG